VRPLPVIRQNFLAAEEGEHRPGEAAEVQLLAASLGEEPMPGQAGKPRWKNLIRSPLLGTLPFSWG
jgi:hypothetical protein